MRTFDYSFLNKGMLPAKLVNLTSGVASLKTMAGVRKEEYARGSDHPEQPHAPFQGGYLQHTARRQPHDGGIRAGGDGPGGAHRKDRTGAVYALSAKNIECGRCSARILPTF